MLSFNLTNARQNLSQLIEQVNENNIPIEITSAKMTGMLFRKRCIYKISEYLRGLSILKMKKQRI
ncbi:type II toxin-antitoxin system prevent-host-death family antitoxin [Oceanobacillus jeddahense]|uniref:type II toxin-antitoxin system prevent-host-death family antitoxin n=1 Tax=Oceanobacillus jeddahense TaxID=1462527 RepID=UPI000595C7EA